MGVTSAELSSRQLNVLLQRVRRDLKYYRRLRNRVQACSFALSDPLALQALNVCVSVEVMAEVLDLLIRERLLRTRDPRRLTRLVERPGALPDIPIDDPTPRYAPSSPAYGR